MTQIHLQEKQIPRKIDAVFFQTHLLDWYHKNKRKMAWRDNPSPYHVWISEIMLQQTRVEAVHAYYARFINRLPGIQDLAEVSEDELHKLWEGLGYYNRAKNLKKAAQLVMKDYGGELPSTYQQLLNLPGIGPYTAGAIASIAFGENVPAVDGNVMRVISRLSGDTRDITQGATKKDMERIVQELLILPSEVQHFNQALMELGALICIPNGAPKCEVCPVSEICYAYQNDCQESLPVKTAKKARRIEKKSVLVFVNENEEFLIQKRPEKGLLSGLWGFPSLEGALSERALRSLLKESGIAVRKISKIEAPKHIFTHVEWHMHGFLVQVGSEELPHFIKSMGQAEENPQGQEPAQAKTQAQGQESAEAQAQAQSQEPEPPEASQSCISASGAEGGLAFTHPHVWCDYASLRRDYGIPTAFKAYLNSIEEGKVRQFLSNSTIS